MLIQISKRDTLVKNCPDAENLGKISEILNTSRITRITKFEDSPCERSKLISDRCPLAVVRGSTPKWQHLPRSKNLKRLPCWEIGFMSTYEKTSLNRGIFCCHYRSFVSSTLLARPNRSS